MEIDLEKIFLSKNDKNLTDEEKKYYDIFSILKINKPTKKTLPFDKKLKLKKSLLERYDFYYQNKKSLKNIILSIFGSLAFLVFIIIGFNNYSQKNLQIENINKNYNQEISDLANTKDFSNKLDTSSSFGSIKVSGIQGENSYEKNNNKIYFILIFFILISGIGIYIYKKKK